MFGFKGAEKQFIAATKFSVIWNEDKSKFKATFDKAALRTNLSNLEANLYYIHHIHLYTSNHTEITMGCDPASFISNVIFYYENTWLLDTK